MTARAFPEQVLGRSILRSGFRYSRKVAIETTPMDSGLARGRLVNSNPLASVPVIFLWNSFQVAFFEAWNQTVASRGAAWFTIYLPLEGADYRQVLAKIADVPERTVVGPDLLQCPLTFDVHDSLVLPDGIVELVLLIGATGAQEMSAALADTTLQPFFDAWSSGVGGADA